MGKKSRRKRDQQQAQDTVLAVQAASPTSTNTETTERGLSEVDRLIVDSLDQPAATDEQGGLDLSSVAALADADPLATFWTELDLNCRDCQIVHYVPICTMLNAQESPHLVERVIRDQFNYKRCPLCRKIEYVEHPWTYYDPERQLIVQVRPQWEWHAGGGEEWYAARLEDLFDRWSEYDVRIEVVFGPQQLIDRFLTPVTSDQPTAD